MIYLPDIDQEEIGGALVVGYDPMSDSAVVNFGPGEKTVSSAMRAPLDLGEDVKIFTSVELKKIDGAIKHLRDDFRRDQPEFFEKATKHLPGQHSQQSHGRGGGGRAELSAAAMGAEKSGNVKHLQASANDFNSWKNADEGQATADRIRREGQVAVKMSEYPDFQVKNGSVGLVEQPKQDGYRLHGAIKAKTNQEVAANMKERLSQADVDGFVGPYSRSSQAKTHEDIAQSMIESWNYNNRDIPGVALQQVAAERFGIKTQRKPAKGSKEERTHAEAKEWLGKGTNKKVVDATADAMYETTQNHLKKHGITEMAVYRGMPRKYRDDSVGKPHPAKGAVDSVQMNTLSSFTTSIRMAESFSVHDDAETGDVIGGVIKAKDIFSLNSKGIGAIGEMEVVVIHNPKRNMMARTFKHNRTYNGDTERYEYTKTFPGPAKFWSDE